MLITYSQHNDMLVGVHSFFDLCVSLSIGNVNVPFRQYVNIYLCEYSVERNNFISRLYL